MWNFSTTGFISVVEYDPIPLPATDQLPKDYVRPTKDGVRSSHLLVRARIQADLDALSAYDPDALFSEDLTADYQFRLIVKREAFAQFQYDQAMGIDYWSHVKEEMNKRSPEAKGRMSAYYKVWNALADIQPNPPYGYNWVAKTDPKALKSTSKTTGSVSTLFDWAAAGGATSKVGCDELWPDDPAPGLTEWELSMMSGQVSRKTMEGQVTEILNASREYGEVDDIVDRLEARLGTCDLDTVDFDVIWEAVDDSADEKAGVIPAPKKTKSKKIKKGK